MQISIIIPIFKAERYIKRCLTSVVNQTFTDYEVVLVDDASPDNSLQIAEQFLQENKVAYQSIVHKTNQKQSEARNTGIKNAKGKYLMFIDNDDELAHNEVLKQFYETIERENVDFVSANHNVVNNNNIEKDDYNKGITQNKKCTQFAVLKTLLLTEISVSPWNKLFKKDFLVNNKLYFLKGMTLEDCLWSFNMCNKAKSCYCLSNYNYNYYYQNNPTSVHANRNEDFINDLYLTIKEILKVVEQQDSSDLTQKAHAYSFFIIRLSIDILAIPFVMQNKKLWKQHYKHLRKIYNKSILSTYEKRFTVPSSLAYFVFTERIKSYQCVGAKFYFKVINVINSYNWQGR